MLKKILKAITKYCLSSYNPKSLALPSNFIESQYWENVYVYFCIWHVNGINFKWENKILDVEYNLTPLNSFIEATVLPLLRHTACRK